VIDSALHDEDGRRVAVAMQGHHEFHAFLYGSDGLLIDRLSPVPTHPGFEMFLEMVRGICYMCIGCATFVCFDERKHFL
jgi:hypothetical protein